MKHRELNIMANVKIIENLKAQLICVIGEFFRLLTKGNNIAKDAILDCLASAITILYVLGDKLGYSFTDIDRVMKDKLEMGIKAEDQEEKNGKSLSKLKKYIGNRMD